MATNSMTPLQDIVTRDFYKMVAQDGTLFSVDPVGQTNMLRTILNLLNYAYIEGCYVQTGEQAKRSFHGKVDPICEWDADAKTAMEAQYGSTKSGGTRKSKSKDKADSSKSTKDSEVRETILREDV